MIIIPSKIKRLILLVCTFLSLLSVNAAVIWATIENVGKPVLDFDSGTLISAGMIWDVPGGKQIDFNKHGLNVSWKWPYYIPRFAYKDKETETFGVDLYEEVTGIPDVNNVVDSCADRLFEQGQPVRLTNKFLVNGGTSVDTGTVLTSADFGFNTHEPKVTIGGGLLCGAQEVTELNDGTFIVYAEYLSQFKDYCDTAGYAVTKTITDVSLYLKAFSYLYTHVCNDETDEVKEQIKDDWVHGQAHEANHWQCQRVTGSIDDWVYMSFVKNSIYARHAIELDYNTQKTVTFRRIKNDEPVNLVLVTVRQGTSQPDNPNPEPSGSGVEIDYEKLTKALTEA